MGQAKKLHFTLLNIASKTKDTVEFSKKFFLFHKRSDMPYFAVDNAIHLPQNTVASGAFIQISTILRCVENNNS